MMTNPFHPAFPQPDPSQVIWRYMDAPKFEWLVANGRLYMSSASQLGDPLEGSTPEGELAWWQRRAAEAQDDAVRRIMKENRAYLSRMAEFFRNRMFYVSCWHMNPHESQGMWGCYTKTSESVAVKSTYGTLRQCLPDYVQMGMVRYADYATATLPTMNLFEAIMHKDTLYDFEREVRAVATPPAVKELGLDDFNGDLFVSESTGERVYAPPIDLQKLIQDIVLHPEAPDTYTAAVQNLCTAHGLPAPGPSRRTRTPVF